MNTTEEAARRTGVMPRQWGTPAGARIHAQHSYRQIAGGTVLLTAMCGQVANLADVTGHALEPTCKRCRHLNDTLSTTGGWINAGLIR